MIVTNEIKRTFSNGMTCSAYSGSKMPRVAVGRFDERQKYTRDKRGQARKYNVIRTRRFNSAS
jgi:hypothetical protein